MSNTGARGGKKKFGRLVRPPRRPPVPRRPDPRIRCRFCNGRLIYERKREPGLPYCFDCRMRPDGTKAYRVFPRAVKAES